MQIVNATVLQHILTLIKHSVWMKGIEKTVRC